MKNINAENISFSYIKKNDTNVDLNIFHSDIFLRTGVPLEVVNLLMNSSFSRLSLFPSILSPKSMLPYVLVWQEEMNLDVLDMNIEQGNYSDQDFAGSIRCYPHRTKCLSCGATYLTLNVDASDPYPCKGGGILLDEKK